VAVNSVSPQLEEFASFGWGNQPTGVAVSSSGRVFVNFPRWFANHTAPSVAEVVDGKMVPFPNSAWNSWTKGDDPSNKFVCVQSVFVDHMDRLWILDPAAAFLGNVTGRAKLMHVDLSTNAVVRTYSLPESVAPWHSYVNDVRISEHGTHALLSDSNLGGIDIVDLATGEARRVLADHPSTHAEQGVVTSVEGKLMYMGPGTPATFQSDGIAVIHNGGTEYLYYHAVTAYTLYRLPVRALTNTSLTDADLASMIETVAASGIHDGMLASGVHQHPTATLFMTAIEKDGVDYMCMGGGTEVLPLVADSRLQWPDSMAINTMAGKTYLYVTASQVNTAPFILGANPRRNPYALYRVHVPNTLC